MIIEYDLMLHLYLCQVSVDIIIPAKIHNAMIGARGKLIQSIMDDCGGVHIKFPEPNSGSDKVRVQGR